MAKFMLTTILMVLITTSSAYDFYVGGRDGWVQNPRESYDSWAQRMRFQVSDKLVFKYKKAEDSVLLVKKEDYDSCNVKNPIQKLEGGDSVFQFNRSGPFYFISGVSDRCTKGQKLFVIVMAERNKKPLPPPPAVSPPSSSPSPTPLQPPAVSPSPSPSVAPTPSPSASPTDAPTPSPTPAAGGPTPSPSAEVSPGQAPSSSNGGGGSTGNEPSASPASAPPGKSSSSALTASRLTLGVVALILAHAFLG